LRTGSPHRTLSPLKSSFTSVRTSSPVRHIHCSPDGKACISCYVYPCSCNLARCACSSCHAFPCCCGPISPVRCACSSCHSYPCCCGPVGCNPVQRPILHLLEEDELVSGLRDFISLERELD
jgi:hypothetical protein